MNWIQKLLAAAALLVAGSTQAASYTPESGFWWNPNEPGTGLAIEIEDDFITVAAYLYDNQGFPFWYLGQGYLTESTGTLRLTTNTYSATGGQCLGCPWRAPVNQSAGGTMQIVFDATDETRATLTWGGQTKVIRRTDYYDLQYGGDANNQRLLGEWQIIIDFASSVSNAVSPFFGDILIFRSIVRDASGTGMSGCRPDSMVAGFCSTSALANHDAFGVYRTTDQLYVLTVTDLRRTGQATSYLHYIINQRDFNVSQFRGVVVPALQGQNPFVLPSYRVNGYRSASRQFVQNGNGPASIDKSNGASASSSIVSRIEQGVQQQAGLDDATIESLLGVTPERFRQVLLEAQARAEAREQANKR